MQFLDRLQALDFVLVIVWAVIVAWGVRTGAIRQLLVAIAVYVAAIAAGQAYLLVGGLLSLITGRDTLPQMQVVGYVALFTAVVALLLLIGYRMYPNTLIAGHRRLDAVLGGVVAALSGLLFLIALIAILRFFTVSFWPDQRFTQIAIEGQLQRSQVVPFLQYILWPMWAAMEPWFPVAVRNAQ